MFSVYKKLSRDNRLLITRLVFCTVIATVFSFLIGEPYSPSAVVTANLFLCTDRGYCGSVRFGTRRVLVHIIQGLLVMAVIFPCKYFELPIPDTLIIIFSCVIAILIGFPLNMKFSYAPVLSTLATATVIIACGTVQSFTRFPYRVLECIGGYAIGYFVNYYLVPPEDRYQKAKQALVKCSEILIMDGTSPAYRKAKNTLDSDTKLLTEDSAHGLKKYHHEEKELLMLDAFKKILEAIEAYQDHLKHYQPRINTNYSKELHKEFHTTWDYYMKLLHYYFNNNNLDLEPDETLLSSPDLNPSSDEEVLLASDIIDFRERLRTLVFDIAPNGEP